MVGKENTVLNPHYKTMGLSGSEYHTYSLPKRVGQKKADELLKNCLPLSTQKAKKIGMIDEVFSHTDYFDSLRSYATSLIDDEDKYNDFIYDKEDYLEENKEYINDCKENEIKIMYPEFWEETSLFHKLRYDFVYKNSSSETPKRLKGY